MEDIKTIIEKIYKDYNPDKVSSIPSLLEKYKGKEKEILSKISDKYSIRLQDYIKVDNLLLVTEILRKYEPVNISSASTLLSNNKNHEDELLKTLCDKYNVKLNDFIISIYSTTTPVLNQKAEIPVQKPFIPEIKTEKKYQELKKSNTGLIIGISAVVIIVIVLILVFSGVFKTKRKANYDRSRQVADSTNAAEKAKREADSLAKIQSTLNNNIMSKSGEYNGSVGNLGAKFSLHWNNDNTIEGTYFYPAQANITYTLKGTDAGNGNIELTEYTGNAISAHCHLQANGNCYNGKMNNTDGRQFNMQFCKENGTSGTPGKYPQATDRLLTDSDVSNLNKHELLIMKNEIYARHGYIFHVDKFCKDYFAQQTWYNGQFNDVSTKLTSIENQNIALIIRYENR